MGEALHLASGPRGLAEIRRRGRAASRAAAGLAGAGFGARSSRAAAPGALATPRGPPHPRCLGASTCTSTSTSASARADSTRRVPGRTGSQSLRWSPEECSARGARDREQWAPRWGPHQNPHARAHEHTAAPPRAELGDGSRGAPPARDARGAGEVRESRVSEAKAGRGVDAELSLGPEDALAHLGARLDPRVLIRDVGGAIALALALATTSLRRLLFLPHQQKETAAVRPGEDALEQTSAVTQQLLLLALPAAVACMAEPLALLVETRLLAASGPVQLAAVGVAVSVFNLVSKVLNFPLLNITTSFVAADRDAAEAAAEARGAHTGGAHAAAPHAKHEHEHAVSPAVSAALIVGGALGVFEAGLLYVAAGPVVQLMGVSAASPMLQPAAHYLSLRAIGAPAVVVSLAAQGVFRGLKDTSTPLVAIVASSAINIALDPLLMFGLGWGVEGAALATVTAQYCMAGYLLWRLSRSIRILPPRLSDLRFGRFLESGGLLFGRTLALLVSVTLATSMSARQGAVAMAAHQICSQTWLAASLLSDSIALAAQTMLASAFARGDGARVKQIAMRAIQMAAGLGLALAAVLGLAMPVLPRVFTKDAGIIAEMAHILPLVVALQPVTSLAFVFDGLHYGASDFAYAAKAMILLVIPAIGVLLVAPPILGLRGVWLGLSFITVSRAAVGFWRLRSKSGPWALLEAAPGLQVADPALGPA